MSNSKEDKTTQQWPALRLFSVYRIIVAIIFFSLSLFIHSSRFLSSLDPHLLRWVSGSYFLIAIIALIFAYFRWLPYKSQVYISIIVDIIAIIALMNLYGGVTSGFGTLIIAVVAGGSLLLPGKSALLFAALATLAILGHEIYANLHGLFDKTAYTQAGLLGAALFATALLAITLAHRASESAKLAAQRGIDLANLAKLNEHLINRMDAGIMVIDDDGTIRMHNHAAWKLLDQPDINEHSKLLDVSVPLFDLYKSWNKASTENTKFRNYLGKLKRTNKADLQIRIVPVGLRKHDRGSVIYLNDNTEVDKQVQETKLASLGRLTASIAHEIRNPLGAISHAAQLLDESSELHKADKRLATIIQDQSIRLNTIINNVLRLSRREKPKPEKINLGLWLRKFIEEFTRTNELQKDWVSLKITPSDAITMMDPNNLHQVLWNLCKNAKKYGTSKENFRLQLIADTNQTNSAPYLDVIDNGPGIDIEHQKQLFEPFFTTSDTGTGLGLYLSRELCKNNGGDLRYISMPEGGSCFRIEFPADVSLASNKAGESIS